MKGKNTVAVVVYLPVEEANRLDDFLLNRFHGSVSRSQYLRQKIQDDMRRKSRQQGAVINA